jgi:hypothetical protein
LGGALAATLAAVAAGNIAEFPAHLDSSGFTEGAFQNAREASRSNSRRWRSTRFHQRTQPLGCLFAIELRRGDAERETFPCVDLQLSHLEQAVLFEENKTRSQSRSLVAIHERMIAA